MGSFLAGVQSRESNANNNCMTTEVFNISYLEGVECSLSGRAHP